MIAKLGIPDDSPENTIRAIKQILAEEAEQLSAEMSVEETHDGVGPTATVNLSSGGKFFRLVVSCQELQFLRRGHGTIGTGFISRGAGYLVTDTLSLEMFHGCPPYRWSVYEGRMDAGMSEPTDRFLDGPMLRSEVRKTFE